MEDYYKILGVDPCSKPSMIRDRFLELLKKDHPKSLNSEYSHSQFLLINEAYSILINPFRRVKYDKLFKNKKKLNEDSLRKKRVKWQNKLERKSSRIEKKALKQESKPISKIDNSIVFFDIFINILDIIFTIIEALQD